MKKTDNRAWIILRGFLAAYCLFALTLIPAFAVRVQAEEDRSYYSEGDSIPFLGDGTYIYEDDILVGAEKRGSIDWKIEGLCLKSWNLKLTRDDSHYDSDKMLYYELREYRGELSEGDTIRISAVEHGTNGDLEVSVRKPDGVGGYDFTDFDNNIQHGVVGCRVDGFRNNDPTRDYTAYWDYTAQKGDKQLVAYVYHDGKNTPTCPFTDQMYIEYKFVFSVGSVHQTSTTPANDKPGEDGGTTIDNDIIEDPDFPERAAGAIGGGIAVGAIIAAGNGKGKKQEPEKKEQKTESRFRMYVYKNFGNAIRKDGRTVSVGARIVELKPGQAPISRNDLTSAIEVFSENRTLDVRDGGMNGMYKNALVIAAANNPHPEGTVSFRYYGAGGVFTKNVVFRLVAETKIVYPELKADKSSWIVNANRNETDVVSGKGGTTEVLFLFLDATEEPKQILFENTDGFSIQAVKDMQYSFTYRAKIENRTAPTEKIAGIFADMRTQKVRIRAFFPDGSEVTSSFSINIYPDGISVPTENQKDGRIDLDTLPDENAVGSAKIPPAMFEVYVCNVVNSKAVIEKNPTLTFCGFFDDGKYKNTFKYNFKYKIWGGEMFSLYPFYTLPVIRDPYEAYLTIQSDRNGIHEKADLPFRLTGEKGDLPSQAEWEEMHKKLKRAVEIFGLGSDPELKRMFRDAKKLSAADLSFLRNWIILSGMDYYQNEIREYAEIDKVMTRYIVVASALVKIGDKAIEIAIKVKWPKAPAALLAAFVNPWKNSIAVYLGQYACRWSWVDLAEGDTKGFEFIQTAIKSFEDSFAELITGEGYEYDLKVLGEIVSLYLMMCFARHYFYSEGKEQGDIFKSIVAAAGDLTLLKLTSCLSDLFGKAVKASGQKVGNFVGGIMKNQLKKGVSEQARKLGMETFVNEVRHSYQDFGTLTNDSYKSAHALREHVENAAKDFIPKQIDETVDDLIKYAGSTANFLLANLINYLYGGSNAKAGLEENESLGLKTEDVLTEITKENTEKVAQWLAGGIKYCFNIDVAKAYRSTMDALDISVRIDGNLLIIDAFGYAVEIQIAENATAMFNIMYETCFGWLEDLWKYEQANDPTWDPRDDLSDDTTMVERQAEYVENLRSSASITYHGS